MRIRVAFVCFLILLGWSSAQAAQAAQVVAVKQQFWPGEPVIIRYSGLPGNKQDWLTLVPSNTPDSNWWEWFYTDGASSGVHTFHGLKPGEYEVRAYPDWPDGGFFPIAREPLEVTCRPLQGGPGAQSRLFMPSIVLKPEQKIEVAWSGLPDFDDNWVSLADAGSPDDERGHWTWIGKTAGRHLFSNLPPGDYEARLYLDWSGCGAVVQARIPFQVAGAGPVGNNDLSVRRPVLGAGIEVVGDYRAEGLSKDAWVGLLPTDVPHGSEDVNERRALQRISLSDGTGQGVLTFQGVASPGDYELRMFDTDAGGVEVASARFVVMEPGTVSVDFHEYNVQSVMRIQASAPASGETGTVLVVRQNAPEDESDLTADDVVLNPPNNDGTGAFFAYRGPVPSRVGDYQARLYIGGQLRDAAPFKVTASSSVTLNKAHYVLGEPIHVLWTAPAYPKSEFGSDGSPGLVVMVPEGTSDGLNFLSKALERRETDGGGRGEMIMKAPMDAGSYEVRLYDHERNTAAKARFSVSVGTGIDATETMFTPGQDMAVPYHVAYLPSSAWLGIVPADAPEQEFGARKTALQKHPVRSGQKESSAMFIAPDVPGVYELRLYDSTLRGRLLDRMRFQVVRPTTKPAE